MTYPKKSAEPLQDHSSQETRKKQEVTSQLTRNALQDLLSAQDIVFWDYWHLQDDMLRSGIPHIPLDYCRRLWYDRKFEPVYL